MADTNPLSNCRLAFIGCGVMAEAIIAGLLRKKLVGPDQIAGSHPRQARREELHVKYGIEMFEQNREAALDAAPVEANGGSLVVLAEASTSPPCARRTKRIAGQGTAR